MNEKRLALYSAGFPHGFARILDVTSKIDAAKVIARRRGKFLPSAMKRAAREGESRIKMKIDCNGQVYERGDVLLDVLCDGQLADLFVLGIGYRFSVPIGNGFGCNFYQYAVVRRATAQESMLPRDLQAARDKVTMDRAMSS
jgi:hypothetical protein